MTSGGGVADLSPQQIACLELVGEGYRTKQIARMLGLSPYTVDNHIKAALLRLNLTDRTEAARLLRDPSQRLASPAAHLDRPAGDGHSALTIDGIGSGRWWSRLLPPIGGRPNDWTPRERSLAILEIALIAVLVLAVTVFVIRTTYRVVG